nr:unnamed protein product [Digitaria exilis]
MKGRKWKSSRPHTPCEPAGSSWYRTHEVEVGREDAQHDGRVVGLGDEPEPGEAIEEGGEVGLVPCPVVDAGGVAEGVE